MNKKLLILVIAIASLLIPTIGAYAYMKMNVVAETNDGTWVQAFVDNGNRCYVIERHTGSLYPLTNTSDSNGLAISCVKN